MSESVQRGGLAIQFLFVIFTRTSTILALVAVVMGLVTGWAASYGMGGSRTALPHLFYLPVILAAVRFSWVGAVAASMVAGVLAGPALPADVAAHTAQPFEGWALRLVIFTLVGLLVAWLVRGRTEPISAAFHDTLVSGRLVQALHRGQVQVHYQPILDLDSGRVVAFEALARWNDPKRGRINPDGFIPQAERTGAVSVLDRYVLREAARQVQLWSQQIAPVGVSVNVSATRFAEHDLVAHVAAVLAETGLPAHALQLEVTESAIIYDVVAATAQIADLRSLGVRVGIDDFGAGQSSLSYLNLFDVDTVKIDRGLVAQTPTQPRTERLLSGVIRMFRELDLTIVAEGVENADQYGHLQSAGCHQAQGFFIGRPASADETETLLRRRWFPAGRETRDALSHRSPLTGAQGPAAQNAPTSGGDNEGRRVPGRPHPGRRID